ncbi:MAG TPA: LLM class flavin-dependent oxidoreductase [Gaiellaceae bacterium]|jgi:alkanesulfonate monooxygenase SsuD/methylene tetrahydromethanopterin reductase-like flavin-dependent oxidoreductase (luciferase family)/hemerythrin-like domain-containing protein|nr:LLM class flavin-dependent oxidoreductase [Gaiellaceae bacterium]
MSDYGHALEFGVFISPAAQAAEDVVALATLADRTGLDLVTFQDHPYQARFLDTWTLLSFVAARTSRVRVSANVLNLPLRNPAVVARAVASLDILSGGRAELGLGAGAFWDGIEAMGGRRLTPRESVDALEEAIDVIRALWDVEQPGPARVDGSYYRLNGAARGPAPLHDIGIWVGAYKPRMLNLTGRKADGWIPSLPYLQPGDLARGNAAIDEAAVAAGRDPSEIRRLLNVTAETGVDELIRYALEDGIATFLVMADDANTLQAFASEVAPAVREQVAAERSRSADGRPAEPVQPPPPPSGAEESEYDRLGIQPTPDDGTRVSASVPWEESTRPHRPESGPEVTYSRRGVLVGQHLVDVHDMLRIELNELREILEQVRDGVVSAGNARSALNDMALRQNDWTLGAFCSRYCAALTQHHGLEDEAIFPHLARSDPALAPVIERLVDEHLVIHDAIQEVDRALVDHMNHPEDYEPIQNAIDLLSDALLSHLSYEEHEIVEPLARFGFYPGQL